MDHTGIRNPSVIPHAITPLWNIYLYSKKKCHHEEQILCIGHIWHRNVILITFKCQRYQRDDINIITSYNLWTYTYICDSHLYIYGPGHIPSLGDPYTIHDGMWVTRLGLGQLKQDMACDLWLRGDVLVETCTKCRLSPNEAQLEHSVTKWAQLEHSWSTVSPNRAQLEHSVTKSVPKPTIVTKSVTNAVNYPGVRRFRHLSPQAHNIIRKLTNTILFSLKSTPLKRIKTRLASLASPSSQFKLRHICNQWQDRVYRNNLLLKMRLNNITCTEHLHL